MSTSGTASACPCVLCSCLHVPCLYTFRTNEVLTPGSSEQQAAEQSFTRDVCPGSGLVTLAQQVGSRALHRLDHQPVFSPDVCTACRGCWG
jgi:hypothetical protein